MSHDARRKEIKNNYDFQEHCGRDESSWNIPGMGFDDW